MCGLKQTVLRLQPQGCQAIMTAQLSKFSPLGARQVHKGQFALGDVLGLQVGGLNEDGHDEVGPR